jgi:uncharacterized protein
MLDRPPIDDALIQEITRRIVEGVHPNRIILFGSYARGDARADSDIDLFVELESPGSPVDRHVKVRRFLRGMGVAMDLIVMTPEEVAERRKSSISLVPIIEREGRVLFKH